jgi:hypothetical protein
MAVYIGMYLVRIIFNLNLTILIFNKIYGQIGDQCGNRENKKIEL